MPESQDISYRSVAQGVLGLLLLVFTGMAGFALSTLSDHASHLNSNDKWLTQLQDTENAYIDRTQKLEAALEALKNDKADAANVNSQQSQIIDLKTQIAVMQHQIDTDQVALHDLSDAVRRALPPRYHR